MTRIACILGVLLLAALTGAPAAAQVYRCQGEDGRTVFTDQKSACPEAEEYEPVGRITPSETPPAPAAREPATPDASAEQALERQWRQKKLEAEQAVQQVRDQRERLQPVVSHCSRGGWVTARDEAGIKQRLNCSELKRSFTALDEAEQQALEYLEEGLAEDCREAGCLPGWIR